ncbi:methionine--tRNA ligase [Candidatus Parcubacteria bacterium]|jgi:methionyl-tRNA synthetase|nr:methionine--tRNA ligase [Candidatus Parcubacteria bacterium]MBT3948848.1 methionine--tRNA ligase [Candidatus Parcubacteria bacterium]
MKENYYITTTLPYVNAKPHIGFALEIIEADVLARYHRLLQEDVVFNTGTDEHGIKIYRKAEEEGKEPQAYVDEYAAKFDALRYSLSLSYTNFIRTTDEHHVKAAQEFWTKCYENGDIYKKNYKIKYCVGCELEKTDSELEDDKCSFHPNLEIELIDEENYFFRFSKYQDALLKLYKERPDFVMPKNRLLEIKNFVENGLQDFSISRLKEKMPWGVPVPNDEDHVMYVWFDALVNYISTIGWPDNLEQYESAWPGIQVAGKDNLRQQSAMWQAMLMSAGLPPSKQIFIHGFIQSGGQKMSKTLGNVVDPFGEVEKYGTDAVRFYLLGAINAHRDGDYSTEAFEEFYTAHLVNGIGNFTSRVLSMIEKYSDGVVPAAPERKRSSRPIFEFWEDYTKALENYQFHVAVDIINKYIASQDTYISEHKPWEMVKKGEDVSEILYCIVERLRHIALALLPIIPSTAEKILHQLGISLDSLESFYDEQNWGGMKPGSEIKKGEILFPRLEK